MPCNNCGKPNTDLEYNFVKVDAINYAIEHQRSVGIYWTGTEWKYSEQPPVAAKEYVSQYYNFQI